MDGSSKSARCRNSLKRGLNKRHKASGLLRKLMKRRVYSDLKDFIWILINLWSLQSQLPLTMIQARKDRLLILIIKMVEWFTLNLGVMKLSQSITRLIRLNFLIRIKRFLLHRPCHNHHKHSTSRKHITPDWVKSALTTSPFELKWNNKRFSKRNLPAERLKPRQSEWQNKKEQSSNNIINNIIEGSERHHFQPISNEETGYVCL